MSTIKITTWNINGIRARKDALEAWLLANKPDVIFLQEVKADAGKIPQTFHALDGYHAFWNGSTFKPGYSGVGVLVKNDLAKTLGEPEFTIPDFDIENRLVQARFGSLILIGIYTPRGDSDEHYAIKLRLLETLKNYSASLIEEKKEVLICGDMNVAHKSIDVHYSQNKPNATGLRPAERAAIDRLMSVGLSDIVRDLHPNEDKLYSWWAYWKGARERNLGWRIDCFYVTEKLASLTKEATIDAEEKSSDHSPVTITINYQM